MSNWFFFSVIAALMPILLIMVTQFFRLGTVDLISIGSSTEPYLFAGMLGAATIGEFIDTLMVSKQTLMVHPALLGLQFISIIYILLILGQVFENERAMDGGFISTNVALMALSAVLVIVALSASIRLNLFEEPRD